MKSRISNKSELMYTAPNLRSLSLPLNAFKPWWYVYFLHGLCAIQQVPMCKGLTTWLLQFCLPFY